MKIYTSGAAIVKKDKYTTLLTGTNKMKVEDIFRIPGLKSVISKKSSRVGRFDLVTRLGCAAAGLALLEAGLIRDGLSGIGFILGGQYGSFVTDMAFYDTTVDTGQLASPHLFSFSLPNIVIGECALQYGLMGPTYCLDSEGGRALGALNQAASSLAENSTEAMLAGWLEVLPDQAPEEDQGAMVVVFEKKKKKHIFQLELEFEKRRGIRSPSGEAINSINELIKSLKMENIISAKK